MLASTLRPLAAAWALLLLHWPRPIGDLDPSCHLQRHSQDPCSGDGGRKRGPDTPAPTGLSSPLGFIPRHFRPKGAGSTTVKIVLKEKHKKGGDGNLLQPLRWETGAPNCSCLPFLYPDTVVLQSPFGSELIDAWNTKMKVSLKDVRSDSPL